MFQITQVAREQADPTWASRISDTYHGDRPSPSLCWSRGLACSISIETRRNTVEWRVGSRSWSLGWTTSYIKRG